MALVSQEVSFTLNLGNYNSAKISVGIHDLDTEKDIEEQIVECRPVIDRVFKGLLRVADKQLEEIQEKTNA
jgi:hypothetical protein